MHPCNQEADTPASKRLRLSSLTAVNDLKNVCMSALTVQYMDINCIKIPNMHCTCTKDQLPRKTKHSCNVKCHRPCNVAKRSLPFNIFIFYNQ